MHYVLLAILLLTAPVGAFALTWDFDDGTTWGWTAQEAGTYSTRGTADVTTSLRGIAKSKMAFGALRPCRGLENRPFSWARRRSRKTPPYSTPSPSGSASSTIPRQRELS